MMKRKCHLFELASALLLCAVPTAFAQEANFDKLANLPFAEGRPTKDTAQTLRDELLFQRQRPMTPPPYEFKGKLIQNNLQAHG